MLSVLTTCYRKRPLFYGMRFNEWVICQNSLTVGGMKKKIDKYMGMRRHRAEAKRELSTIAMKNTESVQEYLSSNIQTMEQS